MISTYGSFFNAVQVISNDRDFIIPVWLREFLGLKKIVQDALVSGKLIPKIHNQHQQRLFRLSKKFSN